LLKENTRAQEKEDHSDDWFGSYSDSEDSNILLTRPKSALTTLSTNKKQQTMVRVKLSNIAFKIVFT